MIQKAILLMVMAITAGVTDAEEMYHMSDEFIAKINAEATTWRAGRNFPKNIPQIFLNSLSCAWTNSTDHSITPMNNAPTNDIIAALPESFDSRTKWSTCPTINEIRNQGHCGSCWAVSVASVISDRHCIGKKSQFHASAEDIVSCCGHSCGWGCSGGYPDRAFAYYCKVGVVSGGSHGHREGCKPYSDAEFVRNKTPQCVKRCTNPAYRQSYQKDLQRGSKTYRLHGEKAIMKEVYANGPVSVVFRVYADFYHYRSGVYEHVSGKSIGGHAVKLIGWGEERGTPYWLIANSWGSNWGERGFFKILRGNNQCGIENSLVATAQP